MTYLSEKPRCDICNLFGDTKGLFNKNKLVKLKNLKRNFIGWNTSLFHEKGFKKVEKEVYELIHRIEDDSIDFGVSVFGETYVDYIRFMLTIGMIDHDDDGNRIDHLEPGSFKETLFYKTLNFTDSEISLFKLLDLNRKTNVIKEAWTDTNAYDSMFQVPSTSRELIRNFRENIMQRKRVRDVPESFSSEESPAELKLEGDLDYLNKILEKKIKYDPNDNGVNPPILCTILNFKAYNSKLHPTQKELQKKRSSHFIDAENEKYWNEIKKQKQESVDFMDNINMVRNGKHNNELLKRKLDFNSELEAIVEINFESEQKIKTRMFLSKDNRDEIYSRDFYETADINFLHLKINVARKGENTRWNYEGDKEIGDNFEEGYTLIITMTLNDSDLRKYLVGKLNDLGIGSLPSGKTIHSHKDSKHPTNYGAKELLQKIVDNLFNET